MVLIGLKDIFEITEGLENKIFKAISTSENYDQLIKNIKSKRYQESKIKRILINILLNITKKDFSDIYNASTYYAHILALSNIGKKNLSNIFKSASLPIIIKKEDFLSLSDSNLKKLAEFDMFASNICSIINNENLNKDYINKL